MKIAALLASSLIVGLMTTAAAPQQMQKDAGAAFAAARAASPTPLGLDLERHAWLEDRQSEGADVEAVDEEWAERWAATARRDERVRALAVRAGSLPTGCVDLGLSDCTTSTGGYLNIGDHRLLWQLQNGFTPETGVAAGYVLLTGDDRLQAQAWGRDGVWYGAPTVIRVEDRIYVAVPGGMAGTGAWNADDLYRFTPDADQPLTEIDNRTWRYSDLPALLPAGLEIWKGVTFDYEGLTARTALWNPDDGNCCPTGGQATLIFEIREGRLVLTELVRDGTS